MSHLDFFNIKNPPDIIEIDDGGAFNRFQSFTESSEKDEVYMEDKIANTTILKDICNKKVEDVLSQPAGDRKYRSIINEYIDRNIDRLMTSGPVYLIAFGDQDQKNYYDLFNIDPTNIIQSMKTVVKATGVNSEFKYLTQNPYLVMFYFCLRYFTLKEDEKGINTTISIYVLAVYWSIFTKFFPKGVNQPVMQYTIDNLTDKFLIKKYGSIFRVLVESCRRSYTFHKNRFKTGNDSDVVAWIQRIRNDQNSMIKKIANEYMKNYKSGNAASTMNDMYDNDTPIVDDVENATTVVQIATQKVTPQIITAGIDLVFAEAAAKMTRVSISNLRSCLVQIMTQKNLPVLATLIESTLFMFLYDGRKNMKDVKSQYFLAWANSLFKKTNSNDQNLARINHILDQWAEETGLDKKVKVSGTRVAYKKAMFLYITFSIQKYM